tara:strand:+ start:362 stop:1447 length:1086 start_codon:yes stop_codon:yes gene_type:complete
LKKVIRYIGSKEKLINFLSEVIFNNYNQIKFLDGFTGTTVVSKYLQENTNFDLYLSDMSNYSEVLSSRLFLNECRESIFKYINEIINITIENKNIKEGIFFNEFSINGKPTTIDKTAFQNQTVNSRMFFTEDVGLKIDTIRFYINDLYNNKNINYYEKNLLLMLLVAFADKNANTTSVYGAYLKKQNRETSPLNKDFSNILKKEYNEKYKSPMKYYKGDILDTLNKVEELDVIYLDPPYNTRRYESNYHILNYICDLDFNKNQIKENSKTGLPKLKTKNLFGSKKDTRIIFEDMIVNAMLKSKETYISYSTDGEMTFEEIKYICDKNNLVLNTYTKDYKKYTSNNNDNDKTLQEIIYRIGK